MASSADNLARVLAKQALEQVMKDITPFVARDVLSTIMINDAATTASSTFTSLKVESTQAYRISFLAESTNNGTLTFIYSPDGVKELAVNLTGTADSVSSKFIYKQVLDAPVYYVRFKYVETASAGYLYSSVTMIEKKVN